MAGVRRIKLGSQGFEVSAQGLGCLGMSFGYGRPKPDEEMIPVIHHAIDKGVTFLDTADFYGPHLNEILLGKALKGIDRSKFQIASKFGNIFEDGRLEVKGDPAYARACCEASLKRLDLDYIDLYYVHRIDTKVPIELTIGELKKLVEEGKIKYIGLSEASPETIRRAHAVHPITAVQIEWSLWTRDIEEVVVPTCRELGIGIVVFSPLGSGFFASGAEMASKLEDNDFRKNFPKFFPENVEHNRKIFEGVNEIAARKGCSAAQLALAWVHHRGDDVVPLPGTTKIENLNKNIAATSIKLTAEEMALLETIAGADAVKGERFPGASMQHTWQYANTPPLSSWKV